MLQASFGMMVAGVKDFVREILAWAIYLCLWTLLRFGESRSASRRSVPVSGTATFISKVSSHYAKSSRTQPLSFNLNLTQHNLKHFTLLCPRWARPTRCLDIPRPISNTARSYGRA